jgi:cytochrome c551/c552
MIQASHVCKITCIAALAGFLGACTTTYEKRDLSHKETKLARQAAPIKDGELLSVRIEAYDPGKLPEDPNLAKGLSEEIRKAESYYLAVQLRKAMQRSGHWGPVRVVPKGTREGEVSVNGLILESDGEILKLEISVKDATGVKWFTRKYESVIDETLYRRAEQQNIDPFFYLHNEIANDIANYKNKLTEKDPLTIRRVSELRFGADFAPNHFNDYVKKAKSGTSPSNQDEALEKFAALFQGSEEESRAKPLYTIERLPPEKDPIVQRVNRIRGREEFLIDTLDRQYDGLARDTGDAYTQWRFSRLKEINAIRESDRLKNEKQREAAAIGIIGALVGAALASNRNCYSCRAGGTIVAGAAVAIAVQQAVRASQQAEADTNIRKAALEELGQSLTSEVRPVVIEVEGETVELKGTVEEKFQKWREILKELREKELDPVATPSAMKSN